MPVPWLAIECIFFGGGGGAAERGGGGSFLVFPAIGMAISIYIVWLCGYMHRYLNVESPIWCP